ncbi:hypothetical protein BGZ61DRAFT_376305 [Ilyonectria robusta]|uniref:uncharacterized protein n=1 Tax=Ilyonectria robusta TaxID=1079257 RepID=UPI001E8CD22F|nr:uncharacterized protein BGZ61DRAFT_376305 [Ilyonectria robusta]KAH8648845.1 hypothetical protein BGZ61DRAFT_376305 [Ilyonectria robusta]
MPFQRLIRFEDENGEVCLGNLSEEIHTQKIEGSKVHLLHDDGANSYSVGHETRTVKKLLSPLAATPLVICVGLNYHAHATEASLTIPKYPVIFTKPADALAGPFDSISVHPDAQVMLDYEGELTVVIGRDAKNVSEEKALNYVLGYTAGNDVSARNFQTPDVSGGQFCYAKSFDKFAPIGPAIVSTSIIPDPAKLEYTTKVNGELRQKTKTSDLIWSVRQLIAHLSRGTTLRKGTLIMTGTPSGVGFFMNPKGFLKNGDVVEIEISQIGLIANKFEF